MGLCIRIFGVAHAHATIHIHQDFTQAFLRSLQSIFLYVYIYVVFIHVFFMLRMHSSQIHTWRPKGDAGCHPPLYLLRRVVMVSSVNLTSSPRQSVSRGFLAQGRPVLTSIGEAASLRVGLWSHRLERLWIMFIEAGRLLGVVPSLGR